MKDFWRNHKGYGFHSDDNSHIKSKNILTWSIEDALKNDWIYGQKDFSKKLHENLIPVPYAGNLEKASIFVFLLNPGYSTNCYLEDHQDLTYKNLMLSNLKQEINTFPFLDPKIINSGGYRWWKKILAPIVQDLSTKLKINHNEAAKELSKKFCYIQACPYHSFTHPGDWALNLPSTIAAKEYVANCLRPRAIKEEVLIIVQRAAQCWGLNNSENILVREKGHRNLSFTEAEKIKILNMFR